MKNLVFYLLAFITIGGYSQNTNNFEGKYLVKGIYVVFAPWAGYKDSIDPRTVEVVNYGDQIILRNFAGADSVIADLDSNRFTVPSQSYGIGENRYIVFGEGYFSSDSIFYHYFYGGGGYDATFDFYCKGPKVQYNSFHDLKEDKDFLICYPNPASQYLNIDLTIPKTVNSATLEIYQMDNRLVHLIELTDRGKFNQKIDIQDLADGIFTIRLLFDNKQKSCCKIIKQAVNKN